MVRGKTVMEKIENTTSRQVTFSKRKGGLFKKARELGVLCDAEVGVLLFSNTGRLYDYSNSNSGMKSLIERYQHVKEGQQFMSASAEAKFWQAEAERVRQQLHNLQENHRQLLGQHLSGLSLENLRGLQEQLETSLHNIRLAKLNGQPEANSRAITSSSSQSSIAARDGATSIRLELSQPHHAERDEEPESPTLGL
ncbi:MADS-box transcription factor 23-like isoform X2 [Hordeum vulgare subsp. vulgare]|uniref:MADS-box transcription factor 23-like isoform X2 n=1 Tax=Hordeum vulgare subsp. vulgare TaxID=112509 RepID=UPI000B478109|nr:MADS-box transcription factor 23-like isoform X2 [Hordeum vulgare subsp. vulgare]